MVEGLPIADLLTQSPTVVCCALFIWYLAKRDKLAATTLAELRDAVRELHGWLKNGATVSEE